MITACIVSFIIGGLFFFGGMKLIIAVSNNRKKLVRKKKKVSTMDIILIIVGVFLLLFTAGMIWIFIEQGSVPDTLITCVFSVLGGECGVMGWIKVTKTKESKDKPDEEVKG